jgi:hypothetical protein
MNKPTPFSHLLQKKGILKNFSIAKTVPHKEIEALKEKVRASTKSEEEYNKVFEQEMIRVGNMHDVSNPIPGIIYDEQKKGRSAKLLKHMLEVSKKLKAQNFTKAEMCFFIVSLISALGLTKEDFSGTDFTDFGLKPRKKPPEDEQYDDGYSKD